MLNVGHNQMCAVLFRFGHELLASYGLNITESGEYVKTEDIMLPVQRAVGS